MTKKKSVLPKQVYVYAEQDGDNEYLIIEDNITDCSEKKERRFVGEYNLVRTGFVTAETKFSDIKPIKQ